MSITNEQVLNLFYFIQQNAQNTKFSTKLSWALIRNKSKIKPLVDALDELRQPLPLMKEYEEKRIALCTEAALTDEKGAPSINDKGHFDIDPDKREALEKDLGELVEANKSLFESIKLKEEEIKSLVSGECDIDLYTVSADHLPETMSPEELETVSIILSEENTVSPIKVIK